jgi:tetratricopeptide (TPR) repeat protein
MLTSKNITELLSGFYKECSLRHPETMLLTAEMLETLRPQFENRKPYEVWDYLKLDRNKFGNEICTRDLTELRQAFFEKLFEEQFRHIHETARADVPGAMSLLRQYYAEALVHFRDDFICLLSNQSFEFSDQVGEWIKKVSKASRYLGETRWVDLYPFYQEIYAEPNIQLEERCLAECISGQIVLYNFPDPLMAEKHFKNASELLPDHILTKRGWGEFYQKTGDRHKARELYLEVISKEPYEYTSYHLIGDCFLEEHTNVQNVADEKKENVPGEAKAATTLGEEFLAKVEFWYNEGWNINFLQNESGRRLIGFYSKDKNFIQLHPQKIDQLLKDVEKLCWYPNKNRFLFTNKKFAGCFNDTSYYIALKELASNYQAADLQDNSDELYKKAIKLYPKLIPAYIDLANRKIVAKQLAQARKYLDKAVQLDPDSYDIYWTLAYYFESTKDKDQAIGAYEKCRQLRPDWSDWIDNFIGNVHFDFAEYDKAQTYYRKAIEKHPAYKIYKDNLWLAMQNEAEQKENKELIDEAIAIYFTLATERNEAKDWNKLGILNYRNKEYMESERMYKKAIELMPQEAIYHENLGLSYEKLAADEHDELVKISLLEKAEGSFLQATKLNDKNGESYNQLGLFYYNSGRFKEAIATYKTAIELQADNEIFIENLALAYLYDQQPDQALEQYLILKKKNEKNDSIINQIGLIYWQKNEHKTAIEYFKQAASINKQEPVYLANIASSARILGKMDLAEETLKKAIAIRPDYDLAYNELARIYFERKEFDKALDFCNEAIRLNPKNFQYHENLGFVFREMGKIDLANEHFQKAVEYNPGAVLSQNELGRIFFNNQEYKKAIDYFSTVIKLAPDNFQYYENLAYAFKNNDQIKEATEYFRKAIDLNPDAGFSQNELGTIFYQQEDYKTAAEYFQKAVSTEPTDATYCTNLALSLKRDGQINKAADAFQQALKIDNTNYLNWNDLAEIHYLNGESEKALACCKKAIELNPGDKNLYLNKAMALLQLGKTEEAAETINIGHFDNTVVDQFVSAIHEVSPGTEIKLSEDGRISFRQ